MQYTQHDRPYLFKVTLVIVNTQPCHKDSLLIFIVMGYNYKDLCAPTMTLAVGLNSCVVLHPVRDIINVTVVHTIPSFKYFAKYELVRRVVADKRDKLA